ncbi:MAG: hypothetical protein AUI16_29815 [Alphaproteobacteria bacterium 13_2_20CM_2_64_7]|nr:MAG: hypothetical protein AUI16_29815 [Alphaproteobacteria bacterium 13_2_20CM_2_64_7]
MQQQELDRITAGLRAVGYQVHDGTDQYEIETTSALFLAARSWPREIVMEQHADALLELLARAQQEGKSAAASRLIIPRGFGESAFAARISTDGRFVAVRGSSGIAIYESESGKEIFATPEGAGGGDLFELIPGSTRFVVASYAQLMLIDFRSGWPFKVIDTLPWNLTNNHAIAVDPTNGNQIAVYDGWADGEFSVSIVDHSGSGSRRVLEAFRPILSRTGAIAKAALTYSDDGRRLALATLTRIIVWDVSTGKRVADVAPPTNLNDMNNPDLAFWRDGQRLTALVGTGRVIAVELDMADVEHPRFTVVEASGLFRDSDGAVVVVTPETAVDPRWAPSFPRAISSSGSAVLAGRWPLAITRQGRQVVLWRSDRPGASILGPHLSYEILDAFYNPGSGHVTMIDRDGMRSLDVTSGRVSRTRQFSALRTRLNAFARIRRSPDDQFIAIREQNKITVVDLAEWKVVSSSSISQDNNFASGGVTWDFHDGSLRIVQRALFKSDFSVSERDLWTGRVTNQWRRSFSEESGHSIFFPWDSNHSEYIAISDASRQVYLVSASDGRIVRTFTPVVKVDDIHPLRRSKADPDRFKKSGYLLSPTFQNDGKTLIISASDPRARGMLRKYLYDIGTGELRAQISYPEYLALSNSGKDDVILTSNGSVFRFDVKTRSTIQIYQPHRHGSNPWVFDDRERDRVISVDQDGTINISRRSTGRLLATVLFSSDEQPFVLTPQGFFSGSALAAERIGLRLPSLKVISARRLTAALARPDLVEAMLRDDSLGEVASAEKKIGLGQITSTDVVPTVSAKASGLDSRGRLIVTATITPQQAFGVGRIIWRRNDALVASDEVLARGSDELRFVKAITLDPGPNKIEIVATEATGRVASEAFILEVSGPHLADSLGRLFVISIGIDNYEDHRLRLSFAEDDAVAVTQALSSRSRGIFETVIVRLIIGRETSVNRRAIDEAFRDVAGQLRSSDTVVVFAAGHGKTVEGKFHFLPGDFIFSTDQSILRQGISQNQWEEWFTMLGPARNVLGIFDTCESGTLTGARLNANSITSALETLGSTTGRAMLTAATSKAAALEGVNEHGLLTAALLEAIEKGDNSGKGILDLWGLTVFLNKRVPEMARETFGMIQVPQMNLVGRNFLLARSGPVETESARVIRSREPTHVVVKPTDLRSSSEPDAPQIRNLKPGLTVRLVSEAGGVGLVAKHGEDLGYVGSSALAPLN